VPAADIEQEQAYIDAAYGELARMRDRAERLLEEMQRTDPDLDWALLRRIRALREEPRALCFGRLDGRDGTVWYVGRRHVDDVEGEPVVIEWRAPVAVPYYRASRREDMGLRRRRQFVVEGRKLLSIGDDVFTDAAADGAVADSEFRGRDALLLELERARTGQMLDIVSTIQPEQDEMIRADPAGVLVVQGGPGSGKTAVGLHRAAFLLYGDEAMARANVLVVGPNRTFLRYIGHVLPSLGEHAVVQATLVGLVPECDGATAPADPPAVERLKGDARMAAVISGALAARRVHSAEEVVVAYGTMRLRVAADRINAEVERLASTRLPYADGRDALRSWLVARLVEAHLQATGSAPADSASFESAVKRAPEFRAALDQRWPSVPAASLVGDILTKPAVATAAGASVLSAAELRLLRRRRARHWTPADAPLIDEAKAQIAGQSRTYGHVIVDEAQDLSPMQLRMLARRCPSGSMTLLGDLAQSIGAWAHRDWREVAEWLPTAAGLRISELRYGYRSTSQVIELASRLLPLAAPHVRPTESVRPGATSPELVRCSVDEWASALATSVAYVAERWPTVGVVAASERVDLVLSALREGKVAGVGDARVDGVRRPVTVVDAAGAKGLEFDAVVVDEPASIIAERPDEGSGLRLLYVALTRPTQHLCVVAAGELPAALAEGLRVGPPSGSAPSSAYAPPSAPSSAPSS
jgi:DNA helicase IV